jgi:hypothetical protein
MGTDNKIRYLHYMAGVLSAQKSDPLCTACKAYTNTFRRIRDELALTAETLQYGQRPVSAGVTELLARAEKLLEGIEVRENTTGQKKAGNCRMPEGVCFVKSSKALIERIEGPANS